MPENLRHLRQAFTRTLLLASRHWRRLADGVAKVHGLSDATALPIVLIGRDRGQTQTALAESMGVEGPSLTRLLDQLAGLGLIVRREAPGDRRANRLDLTEAGETVLRKVEADLSKLRDEVLANISVADLEACLRVLQVLMEVSKNTRLGETQKEGLRKRGRS